MKKTLYQEAAKLSTTDTERKRQNEAAEVCGSINPHTLFGITNFKIVVQPPIASMMIRLFLHILFNSDSYFVNLRLLGVKKRWARHWFDFCAKCCVPLNVVNHTSFRNLISTLQAESS